MDGKGRAAVAREGDRQAIQGIATMTTRELIEHLRTLPPDATVVYDARSETIPLEKEEISVRDLLKKDQIYMICHPQWVPANQPLPNLTTCVCFPGN